MDLFPENCRRVTKRVTTIDDNSNMTNNNTTKETTMNITEETKEVVRLEEVKQPQVVRILDNNGTCVAFVIAGKNGTSVHVNMCQEDNFELQLDKE